MKATNILYLLSSCAYFRINDSNEREVLPSVCPSDNFRHILAALHLQDRSPFPRQGTSVIRSCLRIRGNHCVLHFRNDPVQNCMRLCGGRRIMLEMMSDFFDDEVIKK